MFNHLAASLIALLLMPSVCAQKKRNEKKVDALHFCGAVYNNMTLIKSKFNDQFNFLQINKTDTIVDIGAQSGVYEGALSTLGNLENVHFILVDIDSNCLNSKKLTAVSNHYSSIKPGTIPPSYAIVINTPDSLWLPMNQYNKVWIINTLHEIPNQEKFLLDVNQVVRKDGEVVILEMVPSKPEELHGGCYKPLQPFNEWVRIFKTAGFVYKEKLDIKQKGKVRLHMIRFIKA